MVQSFNFKRSIEIHERREKKVGLWGFSSNLTIPKYHDIGKTVSIGGREFECKEYKNQGDKKKKKKKKRLRVSEEIYAGWKGRRLAEAFPMGGFPHCC